jgi:hypothetical protein
MTDLLFASSGQNRYVLLHKQLAATPQVFGTVYEGASGGANVDAILESFSKLSRDVAGTGAGMGEGVAQRGCEAGCLG